MNRREFITLLGGAAAASFAFLAAYPRAAAGDASGRVSERRLN
jgi:hypothetical protein